MVLILGTLLSMVVEPDAGAARMPEGRASDLRDSLRLTGDALTPWSAELDWNTPNGTTRIQVKRGSRLIDDFDADLGSRYVDNLLWQQSTYTYTVKALDRQGELVDSDQVTVQTPPLRGSLPTLYAADSFWNVPIPDDPTLDKNSSGMVDAGLVAYDTTANLANSDNWGIPIAYANTVTTRYDVACTDGCGDRISFRIPSYAEPNLGSNSHLAVVDADRGTELDMWEAEHDEGRDAWSATNRAVTDSRGWGAMCGLGERCSGAVASGFALFGGVIRPEEILQGHIDHAVALMTPYTRSDYIACPATNTDGKYDDSDAIPEGARIQLDPAVDVESKHWPDWVKVVAHAMQVYGAYTVDTGGNLAIRAEANLDRGYDTWARVGVDDRGDLSMIPWDRMRVLKLTPC